MISVLILAKNEEEMIKVCLESAKQIADEIVFLDTGSADRTISIAQKYTSRIFTKVFDSYAAARNFLKDQARGDWLFYLDADERISSNLAKEIKRVESDNSKYQAYAVPRKNILLGKWQKHGGWWPDYQIRFFKKSVLRGWQGQLHEQPIFTGSLGYFKNSLFHLTHRDVSSMLQKTDRWSVIEAKLRLDAGHPPMSGWRFFRIVFTKLIADFFKFGWRDGVEGVIEYFYQTFSLFITYVKLWEMQRQEKLAEFYQKFDQDLLKSQFKQ